MSSYMNLVIVGNVGRDPQYSVLKDGTQVASFSVAVTERWNDGDEKKERTTWFKVSCWRQLAEVCAKYVRKGSRVLVAGKVGCEAYTDKKGVAQAALVITASDVRFLDSAPDRALASANGAHAEEPQPSDLPF